eukprot:6291380-Prymnesium_polylepis.1
MPGAARRPNAPTGARRIEVQPGRRASGKAADPSGSQSQLHLHCQAHSPVAKVTAAGVSQDCRNSHA